MGDRDGNLRKVLAMKTILGFMILQNKSFPRLLGPVWFGFVKV